MAKGGKANKFQIEEEKKALKEERLRFIQEQKELIQFEIQNNEEKKKYLGKEHDSKVIHLDLTLKKIAALEDQMTDDKIEKRHKLEWELYTKGDRLPNPSCVPEMNTYLYRWHEDDSTYLMDNIPSKTDEVLGLLKILEEFIDDPIEASFEKQENWREVYENFCFELRHHMNEASFRLLRFVDKNMQLTGLNEVNFDMEAQNFIVYLWALLPLPKPMVQPQLISRKCSFDKINVSLSLPKHLDEYDFVVRAVYLKYDHLSKISRSSKPVPEPEDRTINLRQRAELEKESLLKIQKEIVDVQLTKRNLLRTALINQINQLVIHLDEDKDKNRKKKSTVEDKQKEEKLREAKQKQEDYIDNLMKELELNPDGTSGKEKKKTDKKGKKGKNAKGEKGKKGKSADESTDADTDLANSESGGTESSSRSSNPSRKEKKKKKEGGAMKKKKKLTPEQEFERAVERLKNIPLNQSAIEVFNEQEEIEEQKYLEYLSTHCEFGELNLRKYVIFGGLVELQLFFLLTQPYEHPEKYVISIIKLPPKLESLPTELVNETGEVEYEEGEEVKRDEPRKSLLQGRTSNVEALAAVRKSLLQSMERNTLPEDIGNDDIGDTGKETSPTKKSRVPKKTKATKDTSTSMAAHDSISHEKNFSAQDAEGKDGETDPKDHIRKSRKILEFPVVKMKMKDGLIYFDEPILVVWDEEKRIWSTDSCENVEIDGQKLTFELKKCGPIAFATLRYSNLPFQSWDLRPDPKDSTAELAIIAKFVSVVFKIKDDGVCLKEIKKLQNKTVFKDMIGKFYPPNVLVKMMQSRGINIFPEHDAACYIDDIMPKYAIMEDHLYHCMAMICGIFNFHWSRWNLHVGCRKIVMLVRDFQDRWHPVEPSTVVVTPSKSLLVDCTEWENELCEEPVQGMKYYADLFQLMQDQMSLASQKKVREISYKQKETVYEMLKLTKVISFTTTVPESEKVEFVSRMKQKQEIKKKGKNNERKSKIKRKTTKVENA